MRRLSSSWTSILGKLGFRRHHRRTEPRAATGRRRPAFECLETRDLLSITVNTLVDENDGVSTGGVSLRDAVAYAATLPGTDTIDFSSNLSDGTIALTHGQLVIDSDVIITGPGQSQLTIDAQHNSRVFVVNSGTVATISGVTITGGGNVDVGAGIYNSGNLTLDSIRVTDNKTRQLSINVVSNDQGGGINSYNGSLHVLNSEIDANEARWSAGIVFYANDANDTLEIINSVVHSNMARDVDGWGANGGLRLNSTTTDADLTIINSTFSGNRAGATAGIRVNSNVHLEIINSTITNNEAVTSTVGGVEINGSNALVTAHNTIIAGNIDHMWGGFNADVSQYLGSFDSSSSHNLIGRPAWTGFENGVNGNLVGSTGSPLSPGLAPLGDYGGPTKTHALLVGSPALDAGDDDKALTIGGAAIVLDQRGHLRPIDLPGVTNTGNGSVDIGAFEAGNPSQLTVKVLDDELDDIDAPDFDFDDLSLREAIAISATLASDEVITFAPNVTGTIVLGSPFYIGNSHPADGNITIDGPGADVLTIDANGHQSVFSFGSNPTLFEVTIRGLTLTGASGYAFGHGGIASANVLLDSVEITASGGGIIFGYQGYLTVQNSAIVENDGPGIYSANPYILVTNTTISGNLDGGITSVIGGGGGFVNTTITNNAGYGADLRGSGTLAFYNSIVAENGNADLWKETYATGSFSTASSNNLIGDVGNSGLTSDNGIILGPTGDPQLLPLGDYGGATRSHALLPDSPAIDAGSDAIVQAYDLVFDQLGEGYDRILGSHVDIGATEAHVIVRPNSAIEIYGTGLDDEITLTDDDVTFDRIGTFDLDIASAIEVFVKELSGNNVVSAASVSRGVVLLGGSGDDTLTGGSGDDVILGGGGYNVLSGGGGADSLNDGQDLFTYEPGHISFSAIPSNEPVVDANPWLVVDDRGDIFQGSIFQVAWDVMPTNFLVDGSLRVDQIGIVQIVKSTFEYEEWGGWYSLNEHSDWHVDSWGGPLPDGLVYPIAAESWASTVAMTLNSSTPGVQGILGMGDNPGSVGYGDAWPGPVFRLIHLKQEFETYVIGLDGPEGVNIDHHYGLFYYAQALKHVTVYGGVKWYHEIEIDATVGYKEVGRDITDTTGQPTDNFSKALHDRVDYSYTTPIFYP